MNVPRHTIRRRKTAKIRRPSEKDFWDKLRSVSSAIAAILIPVVIAVVGGTVNFAISKQQMGIQMIDFAIKILKTEESAEEENEKSALSKWAFAIISKYSDVPIPEEAQAQILDDPSILPEFTESVRDSKDWSLSLRRPLSKRGSDAAADVVFWNIRHFRKSTEQGRVNSLAQVIIAGDYDIISLQEVEKDAVDLLVSELNKLGMKADYIFHDTRFNQDLALLFNSEKVEANYLANSYVEYDDLLNAKTEEGRFAFPRTPLLARCNVRENNKEQEFVVIAVHLKSMVGGTASSTVRALGFAKLSELINEIGESEQIPIIVGGTFHTTLDDKLLLDFHARHETEFDLVTSSLKDKPFEHSYLSNREEWSVMLDHILISNSLKWDTPWRLAFLESSDRTFRFKTPVVHYEQVINNYREVISDHLPLFVKIRY